jgi:hypothetical protein
MPGRGTEAWQSREFLDSVGGIFVPGRAAGGREMKANQTAVEALLKARRGGATLRQAAAAAGVHVATVCRWQARDPELWERMQNVHRKYRQLELLRDHGPRPRVRWHRDCPLCKARVVVRTAPGRLKFWRCDRWPQCLWASWRPRAPRDCTRCGAPCFWSHSRKSIGCSACGMRIKCF